MKIKPYKVQMKGIVSLENNPFHGLGEVEEQYAIEEADLGIQIAENGKLWICINGISFIQFMPSLKKGERKENEDKKELV